MSSFSGEHYRTNGGEGNFSLVFSATDGNTGETVALKVFRPDRLSDTYRFQSFCREAILLEELANSSQILEWRGARDEFVQHAQTDTGIPLEFKFPYFVVELASTDVAAMIRSGAWTAEQKLVAFRAMCKAVQRIHKRQIVHRDIKPTFLSC